MAAEQDSLFSKPKVVEVNLKIYIHCKGCAKELKKCIHKMEGVYTVDVDMEKDLVKVKGEIEADKLIHYVMNKVGKHAEIAKPDNKNQNQNQKAIELFPDHKKSKFCTLKYEADDFTIKYTWNISHDHTKPPRPVSNSTIPIP